LLLSVVRSDFEALWSDSVFNAAFVEFPRPLIEVLRELAFAVCWVETDARAVLIEVASDCSREHNPLFVLAFVIAAVFVSAVLIDDVIADTTSARVPMLYVETALYWVAVVFETGSPDAGASGGT
jgi:predicted membrane channel-forming protein YqfA (hemolysin III family)